MGSKPRFRAAAVAAIGVLAAAGVFLAVRLLAPGHRGPVIIALLGSGFDARKASEIAPRLALNEKEIPDNQLDDDGNGFVDDWVSWNFADGNNNLTDSVGLGTGSARLAMQACPECRFIPVKVQTANVGDPVQQLADGIDYALERGARVISVPYGVVNTSPALKEALAKARHRGAILVAAAALGAKDPFKPMALGEVFPQAYPDLIIVGSTETYAKRDPTQNFGEVLDFSVVQPRASDPPRFPRRAFYFGSGFAAGEVAGHVARLLMEHPAYDLRTVRQLLREATEPAPFLDPLNIGYGYFRPEALTRLKPASLAYRIYHGTSSTVGVDFNARDDIGAIGGIWVCKKDGRKDSRGVLVLQNNLVGKGRARLLMGAPPEAGCVIKARVSFRGNNDIRDLEITP